MTKPDAQRMTVPRFTGLKAAGHKITMLTAYDYTMASMLDATGIEGILVGDSMSMVVQGHANTLPVTLDEMIYHAEMVGRAVQQALVVVDMPFPSYHLGVHKAIENAGRILKETRCQAVKLEGGADQSEVIRGLVAASIPVMAHVGLRPQSVHVLGGYRVQRDEVRCWRMPERRRKRGHSRWCWNAFRASWRRRSRGRSRFRRSALGQAISVMGKFLSSMIYWGSRAATCPSL